MIEVNNLTQAAVNENLLKKVAQDILKNEKKEKLNLSVALISPAEIKKLNKRYLKKDKPTDVLSFPESPNSQKTSTPKELQALGEVLICPQEVKNNSLELNRSFEEELGRTLIHGILHLLGYNHEESEKKAEKMDKRQNYYLKKYFLKNLNSK